MEAKVILFHSNESDKCKAFINNDEMEKMIFG